MMDEEQDPCTVGHPDSAIRLASAVHRFRVPMITSADDPANPELSKALDNDKGVSFARSFFSTGTHGKTRTTMVKADEARAKLTQALEAKSISHERVVSDARRYLPYISQILLSCKVQPEVARLDERLGFGWLSGLETLGKNQPTVYKSEALMYDLVMTVVCEGLGVAGVATESSTSGDFAAASRSYKVAAGIFDFLANDHLPKWISKGKNVDEDTLPAECSIPVAEGLTRLFMANGQQMAVATVLMKPGVPNYSLLAKLCLGIADELDKFVKLLRKDAFSVMARIDKDIFSLISLQTVVQKSLSLYFQARHSWDKLDYGIAIALLSEATVETKMGRPNVPDVNRIAALQPLAKELDDYRDHMQNLLKAWEKDNSRVYFENVPRTVPPEIKLQEGLVMAKKDPYSVKEVDPVLLTLPEDDNNNNNNNNTSSSTASRSRNTTTTRSSNNNNNDAPPPYSSVQQGIERSDSDLARELQKRFNQGLD